MREEEMTVEQLMEGIALPVEGRSLVRSWEMESSEYERWCTLLWENEQSFMEELQKSSNKEQLTLYVYVHLAVKAHDEYCKRQIDERIYFDTFCDLTIWYHCCKKKKGICGLIEARWLLLFLKLQIFRLGRLQFEPEILGEDKVLPDRVIPAGTGVLHVHIPEGEPLTPELCGQSFARADQFFEEAYTIYDCSSWLLSPKLEEILDDTSNVILFQRRFDVCDITYPFRQAEERIFGMISKDTSIYPEKTSLQRKVKAYVVDGSDLGMGYGVIYR